jgi:transposase
LLLFLQKKKGLTHYSPCHEAAAHFGVAVSTAIKWMQRYRAASSIQGINVQGVGA